ncbi:hypothetical protein D3C72_1118530 [compost metagenome]
MSETTGLKPVKTGFCLDKYQRLWLDGFGFIQDVLIMLLIEVGVLFRFAFAVEGLTQQRDAFRGVFHRLEHGVDKQHRNVERFQLIQHASLAQ